MVTWGYTHEQLWVEKKTKTILLKSKLILSISLENLKMKLTYGPFWEQHIQGDVDFKKLQKDEQNNLDRPSKGDGKGKEGKAGKVPPSPS